MERGHTCRHLEASPRRMWFPIRIVLKLLIATVGSGTLARPSAPHNNTGDELMKANRSSRKHIQASLYKMCHRSVGFCFSVGELNSTTSRIPKNYKRRHVSPSSKSELCFKHVENQKIRHRPKRAQTHITTNTSHLLTTAAPCMRRRPPQPCSCNNDIANHESTNNFLDHFNYT